MNDFIRKIAEAEAPEAAVPTEGTSSESGTPSEEDRAALAMQLEAAFDAIELGVADGVAKDFANERPGTIFGSFLNSITSLLAGSLPSTRLSETKVKVEVGVNPAEQVLHERAIKGFKEKIVAPARQLYLNNFSYYIDIVNNNKKILSDISKAKVSANTEVRARSISSEIMGLTLRSAPKRHRTSWSQWFADGPYQIVMTKAIDQLREKFSAITTFPPSTGKAIASRIREGSETPGDKEFLQNLFIAIHEWDVYLSAFGQIKASGTDGGPGGEDEGGTSDDPTTGDTADSILGDTVMMAIEPGEGMRLSERSGAIQAVDADGVDGHNLRIIFKKSRGGGDLKRMHESFEKLDYIKALLLSGTITPSDDDHERFIRSILSVTSSMSESAGTREPTVVLAISFNNSLKDRSEPGDAIFTVFINGPEASMEITAEDNRLRGELTKLSSDATTSLYETVSPDGERVFFTPADLVIGGGKVRGAKGKPFKPKRIKGKSLADRVNSKSFGKIRNRGGK